MHRGGSPTDQEVTTPDYHGGRTRREASTCITATPVWHRAGNPSVEAAASCELTGQAGSGDDALDREVRLHVFDRAAETARVPSPAELAAALGRARPEIEESLRRLGAGRAVILAPGTANIWAANPFSAVPSSFRVDARGRTYWGICIWDALGIPAALGADATVTARCGDCDEELILEVRGGTLARVEGIVHFGVPAARWWDNIGYT